MTGSELSIGIGHGSPHRHHQVRGAKPIALMRETAQCLALLLSGEPVRFNAYPTLAAYFNLAGDYAFRLQSNSSVPKLIYGGGNGPKSLIVAGEEMDGVIFGGTLLAAATTGKLGTLLSVADDAASKRDTPKKLRKIAELKVSVARHAPTAREFAKESVAHFVPSLPQRGYTDADLSMLGIEPDTVAALAGAIARGANAADFATPEMIDAIFIAGSPESCRQRMQETAAMVRRHGFDQVMFSELGPNLEESLELLTSHFLPLFMSA